MHPSPSEDSQHTTTQSQFAHLRNIEPTTTSTGVVPHQALFDTPSPGQTPLPELERSHRSRKPTQKLADSQAKPPTNASKPKPKTKGKSKALESTDKHVGSAIYTGTPTPTTKPGSQAGNQVLAAESSGPGSNIETQHFDAPSRRAILEEFLGHSVSHISAHKLKEFIQAIPDIESQASALEIAMQPAKEVTKSSTGVGLASGNEPGSSTLTVSDLDSSRSQNTSNVNPSSAPSLKRPPSSLVVPPSSVKRVRLTVAPEDGTTTEDEDEDDHEPTSRRRESGSDSDSDIEPSQPPPAYFSKKKRLPTAAGKSSSKASLPRPTTLHPPLPSSLSAPGRTDSTSANSATNLPNQSSNLAPSPNRLPHNEIDAIIAEVLRISEERARALDQGHTHPEQSTLPNATADHIAKALASHRSGLDGSNRSSSSSTSTSTHSSQPLSAAAHNPGTPIISDDEAVPSPDQKAKHKKQYKPKAKLSDFPGAVGEVASAAIPAFLATILVEGSYESPETFRSWALDAFRQTWDKEASGHAYEAPPKAVLGIIIRRASWLRGKVKERLRAIIQYGYGFRAPAASRKDLKHNRKLSKRLAPHVFHCKDPNKPRSDQYEHPEFIRAIGAGLFWDAESIGVAFGSRLKPVPIPTVALVLTMMQACIAEWGLGYYKPQELDLETQKVHYEGHLLGLYEYEKIAATRLTRFRYEWYDSAIDYSGVTMDQEHEGGAQAYTQACDVRPDTPPPDLDEGMVGEGGD